DHPILGFNYRISELNAAVGLAQLRKLDDILSTQRTHKNMLKSAMQGFPRISFRNLPDESGDSATFLSFMLPDEAGARQAAGDLAQAGVDGCFYWYDNNWHYLRKWHHLKDMKAAAGLAVRQYGHRPDYKAVHLPKSDAVMSRTISMQIKLGWTQADIEQRVANLKKVLG
ncbi:MAG: DegT/DnrJ/EryC1/StrS family aminotransferase, partial [Desulfosarcinaceae bacterium]